MAAENRATSERKGQRHLPFSSFVRKKKRMLNEQIYFLEKN